MFHLNRRTFLRGLGGITVGLPLMDSLRARADQGAFPKRFLVVYSPNGVMPSNWFPTPGASETQFTLGPCHQPLLPHKDKLIVLRGIQLHTCGNGFSQARFNADGTYQTGSPSRGEPHQKGMGTLLTGTRLNPGPFVGGTGEMAGWASGISIDQVIHQATSDGRRSLQLGVRPDNGTNGAECRNRLSYLGSDNPLHPVTDPRQAFDDLFGDVMTEPDALARVRAERGSVLDAVAGQFAALMPRLSGSDRQKLDQHLTLVRDLEARVTAPPIGVACNMPVRPDPLAVDNENTMAQLTRNHMDVLASAFACDQVRVATLQISSAVNHIAYPWVSSTMEGHSLSHMGPGNATALGDMTRRDTWHAEQIAYLLGRLAATPEGSGSALDNTLVLWVNELALGATHDQSDMPFVLAGGAGGALRTGRYVQLGPAPGQAQRTWPGVSQYPYMSGRSHCDLLVTILQAFGVNQNSVGASEFNFGPITELLA